MNKMNIQNTVKVVVILITCFVTGHCELSSGFSLDNCTVCLGGSISESNADLTNATEALAARNGSFENQTIAATITETSNETSLNDSILKLVENDTTVSSVELNITGTNNSIGDFNITDFDINADIGKINITVNDFTSNTTATAIKNSNFTATNITKITSNIDPKRSGRSAYNFYSTGHKKRNRKQKGRSKAPLVELDVEREDHGLLDDYGKFRARSVHDDFYRDRDEEDDDDDDDDDRINEAPAILRSSKSKKRRKNKPKLPKSSESDSKEYLDTLSQNHHGSSFRNLKEFVVMLERSTPEMLIQFFKQPIIRGTLWNGKAQLPVFFIPDVGSKRSDIAKALAFQQARAEIAPGSSSPLLGLGEKDNSFDKMDSDEDEDSDTDEDENLDYTEAVPFLKELKAKNRKKFLDIDNDSDDDDDDDSDSDDFIKFGPFQNFGKRKNKNKFGWNFDDLLQQLDKFGVGMGMGNKKKKIKIVDVPKEHFIKAVLKNQRPGLMYQHMNAEPSHEGSKEASASLKPSGFYSAKHTGKILDE